MNDEYKFLLNTKWLNLCNNHVLSFAMLQCHKFVCLRTDGISIEHLNLCHNNVWSAAAIQQYSVEMVMETHVLWALSKTSSSLVFYSLHICFPFQCLSVCLTVFLCQSVNAEGLMPQVGFSHNFLKHFLFGQNFLYMKFNVSLTEREKLFCANNSQGELI